MKASNINQRSFKHLLYFITLLTVVTIIVPGVLVGGMIYNHAKKYVKEASEGVVDLFFEGGEIGNQVLINGEWICYDGIYIDDADEITEILNGAESRVETLPQETLIEAKGQRTYKLSLGIKADDAMISDMAFSIDFSNESVKVYLNGIELPSYRPIGTWIGGGSSYNMYLFEDAYDGSLQYQDVLVSINEDGDSTDLYRRGISLGTAGQIIDQAQTQDVLEMFLVGLMLLSIIMGIIYLVMMPSYSVLTFMNLFDAALMLYIYYNVSRVPGIISSYFFGEFQDSFLRSQALMMLFIAGALGNILGQVIYDPDRECSKYFGAPINLVWFVMALYFGLYPENYTDIALVVTLILLSLNFVGLIQRICRCYKSDRWNRYLVFHLCKTVFVGGLIMWDVATLNTYPRNETALVLGYMIYFVIHFFIRTYEYVIPFRQIEKHNEVLEKAVEERTLQLVEANEVLMQMNIIDGLTKANNRAYFEELLDEKVNNYENGEGSEGLYLCIFDLDNFKTINDTYGHSVGDEQLIELVSVAKKIVPGDINISRIGGEEFALIFDSYYEDSVVEIVEKIRVVLEERAENEGRTTGSFGVSKYQKGDMKKNFFIKADKCLYYSKENGKNCITEDFSGKLHKI